MTWHQKNDLPLSFEKGYIKRVFFFLFLFHNIYDEDYKVGCQDHELMKNAQSTMGSVVTHRKQIRLLSECINAVSIFLSFEGHWNNELPVFNKFFGLFLYLSPISKKTESSQPANLSCSFHPVTSFTLTPKSEYFLIPLVQGSSWRIVLFSVNKH